jgi:hypothetical protein
MISLAGNKFLPVSFKAKRMKWQGHGYVMRQTRNSINISPKNLKRIILKLAVKKWLVSGGAAVVINNSNNSSSSNNNYYYYNNNLRFQNWHAAMHRSTL